MRIPNVSGDVTNCANSIFEHIGSVDIRLDSFTEQTTTNHKEGSKVGNHSSTRRWRLDLDH